jgi:hypothetical protein
MLRELKQIDAPEGIVIAHRNDETSCVFWHVAKLFRQSEGLRPV